jgi:hypothetical protein
MDRAEFERPRPLYYAPDGTPLDDVLEWARLFESSERVVKQTRHKERGREFWLSTVWIGIDHNLGFAGPPLVYETMVFDLRPPAFNAVIGEKHGNECDRYETRDEAEAGHDPWRMTGLR